MVRVIQDINKGGRSLGTQGRRSPAALGFLAEISDIIATAP